MLNSKTLRRQISTVFFSLAVLAVGVTIAPSDASACGGFFCNQQQPVRQAFERILFVDNMDGTVTAVIQIQYQGPSEQFAWLLPVPGKPDVGVSSNNALTRLENTTDPSYQLDTTVKGKCKEPAEPLFQFGGGAAAEGAAVDRNAKEPGVSVVDGGTVGPYDYEVISVSEKVDEPAKEALDWLTTNGYDLPNVGPDLIREYLNDDMNLVAFKLNKSASSGDIRPVKITYEWPQAMIPIKLTAVAANQDMGVLVWLAGPERGIPTKYKALELNQAAINWFSWQSNYDAVISQAADEAGGRGFVTEFAKDSSEVKGTIFTEDDRETWQSINDVSKWNGSEGELLFEVINTYGGWDGIDRAVREGLMLDGSPTASAVVNNPDQYFNRGASDIEELDRKTFLSAVKENVVKPVRETEKLVQSRPFVTRLYTTMSPDEMEVDPVFNFNPDLPTVDNNHTAKRTVHCSRKVTRAEAPWKAVLPDGTEVRGRGNRWPLGPNTASSNSMPAAKVVKEVDTSGMGEIEEDNSDAIQSALDDHNSTISLDTGGCGCTSSGDREVPSNLLWLLIAGIGWFSLRRRD